MHTQRGIAAAPVIAGIAVAVVIGVIIYFNVQPAEEKMAMVGEEMMKEGEKMMDEATSMIAEGEKMMDEATSMMEPEREEGPVMSELYEGEILAGTTTPFLAFEQDDFERAQAEGKHIMLFFYANWCPTCKAEIVNAVIPAFNELDRDDVVAFRVNYNDFATSSYEKDLARTYQIAYQHTKIFINNEGEQVGIKDQSTWTKDQYLEAIAKRFPAS